MPMVRVPRAFHGGFRRPAGRVLLAACIASVMIEAGVAIAKPPAGAVREVGPRGLQVSAAKKVARQPKRGDQTKTSKTRPTPKSLSGPDTLIGTESSVGSEPAPAADSLSGSEPTADAEPSTESAPTLEWCPTPRFPIRHGIEVGPATVGLAGAGVNAADLTPVAAGRASALANGTDLETGRPMLNRLDIRGQLTIDVPCVINCCRVAQTGGLYALRNSSSLDFEARDCDFEAMPGADGVVTSCVVLHPRTMRRCVVTGGSDGVKLSSAAGCLIEDCWIFGQTAADGSHNDAVQAMKGTGDWDTWLIRRCRIEGPWQAQTSAAMLKADLGDLSGVTIRECLLTGGAYTLYTRAKTGYAISRIRVVGNVWAGGSWQYGPHSSDCKDLDWQDNWVAPVTSAASPVGLALEAQMPLPR
jgi:hypothetical protein